MRLILLSGLLATVLAATLALTEFKRYLESPAQTPGREITITIPKGQSLSGIARYLEAYDVVDARALEILARLRGVEAKVRSGRFRLHSGWAPGRILQELTVGREVLASLYIPEGLPWWEVAKLVEKAGYGSAASFKAAIHDPELLKARSIPAKNAEGYLYPDTYHLPDPKPEPDARDVVIILLDQFDRVVERLFPEERPGPEKLHELVILASIVEKETGRAEERSRVAGVYANRLKKGMRLQADPTIIYGIGPKFGGNIRYKHLRDRKNRYNTYKHDGLPPGPICSPSGAALAAANQPESHDFLYFVAKGNGLHQFSTNLPDHNAAVRKYQLKR